MQTALPKAQQSQVLSVLTKVNALSHIYHKCLFGSKTLLFHSQFEILAFSASPVYFLPRIYALLQV